MQSFFEKSRVVIKVGSNLVADETAGDNNFIHNLTRDIALNFGDNRPIVVSSGAVAFGRKALKINQKPISLGEKQAAAACGQPLLMSSYASSFAKYGISVAQVLLTPADTEDRRRFLNARATIDELLKHGVIPIINENDSVATDELRFGDNDRLSARIAQMMGAELLIILSDIDGLYTANPQVIKNATHIPEVLEITPEIESSASGAGSDVGTGGMKSKIMAAKIATVAGIEVIIASGRGDSPLSAINSGEGKFTRFAPSQTRNNARKQWIAGSLRKNGCLMIDDGAVTALKNGKSLLPSGVLRVDGDFSMGDTVSICRADNNAEVAVGLVAYDYSEARQIIGHKSGEIERILGYCRKLELVHRDDMVLNDN